MKYISVRVRNGLVCHGYDADNQEILEELKDDTFVEKLLLIDRIQSIGEKYILVTASHGRAMYWEYEGGFEALKARLYKADLLI
ncbi:hypothetical protein [Piscinibacter sp. XHJ-5]|uniref:hypothetical protein n=1 Tax=Piscinibacter sp. XHJ-5 TaxID=3037797 RepID=UPI0024535C4D|nr:hypothetical protein [Piscinibacter sp. XHJ-5]